MTKPQAPRVKRTAQGLWTERHVADDGRLVSTGLPPEDWCLRVAMGTNGSDRG